MQETYQFTFGSPGSELKVARQALPAITDPPDGSGGVSQPWLILLGFVTWDATNSKFTGVSSFNPNTNIGPLYVGVSASTVISESGSLLLATDPATSQGSNPPMAIEIQENPPQFVFGKLGTDGSVTPALTVKANGDVVATGQVSGAVTPGSMQVQSGVAFDGMTLPLPVGIQWADVAAGKVTIHSHVTVRYDNNAAPISTNTLGIPQQCTVDPATGLISCRLQWYQPGVVGAPVSAPAPCDYLVIAAVAATS
jgi:hypothetical protein